MLRFGSMNHLVRVVALIVDWKNPTQMLIRLTVLIVKVELWAVITRLGEVR